NRREFITLLGGAAAAWPPAAHAQQQPKMLRVGFVGMQPREAPHYTNFLRRMAELDYQEGRNFTVRHADRAIAALLHGGQSQDGGFTWRFFIGCVHCSGQRGARMKRREFITLLGGVAAAWPLAARAQQS